MKAKFSRSTATGLRTKRFAPGQTRGRRLYGIGAEANHRSTQTGPYRKDFIPIPLFTFEGPSATFGGFLENGYWRYYDAFYGILERLYASYPDLIFQMCSNGGAREDLGMMSRVHETYTNEGEVAEVLRPYAGKTLALPPEILSIGTGIATERGHLDTFLRTTFTLGTPWILNGAAPSFDELVPQRLAAIPPLFQYLQDLHAPVVI
jgi:hypothetical protein